jgi:formamidopyrimidine-DNA glycosylase
MPELPEVETVRRMLDESVVGRTVASVRLSGLRLRVPIPAGLPARARGRRILAVRRTGKYLMIDLAGDLTLLSHLGMSGRWLFHAEPPSRLEPHVHARVRFADGAEMWYQDPRRFGLLRAVATPHLAGDPALAGLGPDPIADPPTGAGLAAVARGVKTSVKAFLLDQRRVAGIGNIYASEILHLAGVDPRRRAGALARPDWDRIAAGTTRVLGEAIDRMGTTFRSYRTPQNEPGAYGERLLVYDRADEPCRRCGGRIRRIVQAQRSTFFCPSCQTARGPKARKSARPR